MSADLAIDVSGLNKSFGVEARPDLADARKLKPGQPLDVTLQ